MPPGAIGNLRLVRGGPLSGYFQPVRIQAPEGAWISLVEEGNCSNTAEGHLLVGMLIAPVYRLKVSNFSPPAGVEVYPTIEIIDRLYPPAGLAQRYPIPIELTREELQMAADGMFVTRVIYVENPNQALPIDGSKDDHQQWVEVPRGADPLAIADEMGRPVAILRIGGRVPNGSMAADACPPPVQHYDNAN